MQTENARVTARVLRNQAHSFETLVEDLNIASRRLMGCWQGGECDEFCRKFRSLNRCLNEKVYEISSLADRLNNEINEWENTDRTMKGSSSKTFGSVASSVAAGQVLGISTVNLEAMSWKEKYEMERQLSKQISEIESSYHNREEITSRMTEIEDEINDLVHKRDVAQDKANHIFNQIVPDLPLEADGEDGVPWRVKADDYEDQVKQYDEQIAALRSEKTILGQYDDLLDQHQDLNQNIQNRLADVNPANYKSCAIYAAARRPDLGSTQSNREEYVDQAAANYISKYKETAFQVAPASDLTDSVGVGYAVVWEPGVQNSNSTYGHVAIVEEVGKDFVVVSHAGWSTGTRTKISIGKLQELWLIP